MRVKLSMVEVVVLETNAYFLKNLAIHPFPCVPADEIRYLPTLFKGYDLRQHDMFEPVLHYEIYKDTKILNINSGYPVKLTFRDSEWPGAVHFHIQTSGDEFVQIKFIHNILGSAQK